MGKYLFLILFLASCQKQIEEPSQSNLLGIWKEVSYNTKIEIKENEILQLIGFPLVKGDKIVYSKNENILNCKFSSLIIPSDSFNLEILQLTDTYLKFRMQRTPLIYELEFTR
ncbi:MAG TPA: hypothetical protein P5513_06775 [Candidatus Diapherotrites archaeon]|nr:hypothetical protein [Candidatus Diapherotrites archaeon]